VVSGCGAGGTSWENAAKTGVIAASKRADGHYYVLADRSCRLSPDGWARRACIAYDVFKADRLVPEVNNGGEMVTLTIRTVRPGIPVRPVHASRGKRVRAEPIAALYEQGKVHHVGSFPELEDEMCDFDPITTVKSPNRMDALVWALTELSADESTGMLDFMMLQAKEAQEQPGRPQFPIPTTVTGIPG